MSKLEEIKEKYDRKTKELRLEQWSKEHPGHTEKQAIEWIMENLL